MGWALITPKCATPVEVKGMWWGVLQKGQCLGGNIQYYGDYKNTRYSVPGIDHKYYYEYDVKSSKYYQVPIYAFPFIFGTISNVILLIIIICNKDMRTVPNMYILNLAICDIVHFTVLFSEACANRISDRWLDGDFICTSLPFCRRMSVVLSAYSIAVFSFQRCRVTVSPFQVRASSQAKWRVTVAPICGVWIVAALFSVPSALSKYQCEGFRNIRRYYPLGVIFELLVSCVLPLCGYFLLRHDRPPSSGKLSFYIWGDAKSTTEHTQKCCKNCGGTDCCFADQLRALSRFLDIFHLQQKRKSGTQCYRFSWIFELQITVHVSNFNRFPFN